MVHCTELRALKVKGGKYVTVWKFKDGPKLCARDHQGKAPSVHIYRRVKDQKNQMAFRFQQSDGYCFPKVVGINLMLDKLAIPPTLTDSHWFNKINLKAGEHYGLQSVGEPSQYLSVDTEVETMLIRLSAAPEECVQVTDEFIA